MQGTTKLIVDITSDTWCIDVEAVKNEITPQTKAIIGVNLYGSMCDWLALRSLATEHNLFLLEGAAEALGSTLNGQPAGSFGDCAVFSFHRSKTIVTGEGGMFVTDNDDLHARVQKLRDHGRPPRDRFFQNDEVAFKYKMSAVQAALGLAQMERIDSLIEHKRQIFNWYQEILGSFNKLALNVEPARVKNSYWMVTIIPDASIGIEKFEFQDELRKRNIDSRPFFSRLSTLPAYNDENSIRDRLPENPNGSHPATYGINLPSGYDMNKEKVKRVCGAVIAVLE